jgi:hypothetical protein
MNQQFPERKAQSGTNGAQSPRGIESAPSKLEMPATQFGGVHLRYASLPFDSPFPQRQVIGLHPVRKADSACAQAGDCSHARWPA